jgi:hypothetical protein
MIERAARGVWEFVVGDDWRAALWVVAALAATAVIASVGWPAWWITPVATLAILRGSVKRGSLSRRGSVGLEEERP